jgi:anthranilate phosphoribosyltransferase
MRTIFNVLGPLTNPAGADAQVVGVYDPELVQIIARALTRMDIDRALVVHGSGIDEIAIHDETTVAEVTGDDIEEYTLTPETIGLDSDSIDAVSGGSPAENAADMRGIITGDITGPKRDIILANAGAAIYIGGEAETIAEGVERAENAIESEKADSKLDELCGIRA